MNTIGERLLAALTKEELSALLQELLANLDAAQEERLLSRLSPSLSEAVREALHPRAPEQEIVATDSRIKEEWKALWEAWKGHVAEVGDEEGKYSEQEVPWEPPYFHSASLSDDLEEVAGMMLAWLEPAALLGLGNRGLFERALEDVADQIGEYPEWIGALEDGCELGPKVTEALLLWARLHAKSPVELAVRMEEYQRSMVLLELDEDTFADFFLGLPAPEGKALYDYLNQHRQEPPWKDHLEDVHSVWHSIYHYLAEEHDPETYLRDSTDHVDQVWEYGIPLVEDLLARGRTQEAEAMVERTFQTLVGGSQPWRPEEELLDGASFRVQEGDERVVDLLNQWITLAEGSGQGLRAKALRLQREIFQYGHDWDRVASTVQSLAEPALSPVVERWMARAAREGRYFVENVRNTWPHWLLEAGLDEAKGPSWFIERVKSWLESLSSSQALTNQKNPLFSLTSDLLALMGLRDRYPHLLHVLYGSSERDPQRLRWLERLGGRDLAPLVLERWRSLVVLLAPDPSSAYRSDYEEHARWMLAVRELNPEASQGLLERWRQQHKRRTNLWAALRKHGITS